MVRKICTISLAVLTLAVTACGGGSGTNSNAVLSEEISREAVIKLAAESLEDVIDIYSEDFAECMLEGFREFASNNISWKDIAEALERDDDLSGINTGLTEDEQTEAAQEVYLRCLAETDIFQELMDDAVEDVISNSDEGGNYGDDPYLDSLYDQCANGDDEACDDLFWTSPYAFAGSEYVDFALTCGGRDCQIPISEMGSRNYWPMRYGDNADLDNLYDQCANGDDQACNDLFLQSNETSEYSFFAALCGFRDCVIPISETFENDTPETDIPFFYGEDDFLDNLYDQCADGNDEACDDLFWQSVGGSQYGNFALTCGGRGCQIPMDGRSMNYGDNAYLDNLYDQCADGNDQACNDLYFQSFGGSEYEEFALTCGGRGCQIPR
tara:strand:- start:288 stop:1436 length:1149 start_codon:yes stop_codon:yes gene_type:complete